MKSRRKVFVRRDQEVLASAECWARAMGGALRELTPEAAAFAARMYYPDLPGRRLEDVVEAFQAVAARETKAEEARRAAAGAEVSS